MQFTQTELYMLINLASKALWLVRADLSEANLSGADLSGADLWGANLDRANLDGANLRNANLAEASLEGANLTTSTTLPDGAKWSPRTDMAPHTRYRQT